jgi:CRISPR-associated protein Cst2
MKPRTIQGFVLVDAPYSALNNAGTDASERTDNIVRTKSIWRSGKLYPYVSGQAWRYWWREALEQHKKWPMSPVTREKKIAYTEADPFKYPDDDIFGYMRAPKKKKGKKGGAATRVSVLKNSPLISVIPQKPTADFGTFSRHEGDPVPYEHEFYSTILKGIFSLDINTAGVFFKSKQAGKQNLAEDADIPKKATDLEETVWLPKEQRVQRIKETIEVIPHLAGGAMQARHLTRVAPSFVVLATFDTGSHLLSHLAREEKGMPDINIDALKEVLESYGNQIPSKMTIGLEKGFMEHLEKPLTKLAEQFDKLEFYSSTAKAVEEFLSDIEEIVPETPEK